MLIKRALVSDNLVNLGYKEEHIGISINKEITKHAVNEQWGDPKSTRYTPSATARTNHQGERMDANCRSKSSVFSTGRMANVCIASGCVAETSLWRHLQETLQHIFAEALEANRNWRGRIACTKLLIISLIFKFLLPLFGLVRRVCLSCIQLCQYQNKSQQLIINN